MIIEERRLGKSDDKAKERQTDNDKDELSDDDDKVLTAAKLEKKIKAEINKQTKTKKAFVGKFGEDNDSLRSGAAKMLVAYDR